MRQAIPTILAICLIISLSACGGNSYSESDPRQVVIKTFGAMEDGNRSALAHYLDFGRLLNPGDRDITLKTDSVRNFRTPDELLDDLLEGGLTHDRWFAMQRVVGSSDQIGDTAWVEVSFISNETNRQYLNKWGLHKIDGNWKIFSFATMDADDY